MQLRLLFFVSEDWYFLSHRLALALGAQDAGFEVVLVTQVNDPSNAITSHGIRLVPFAMSRRSLNPLGMIATVVRLASIYRRERPDIVHHVALKPVIIGTLASRLAGVKNVVNAIAGLGWLYTAQSRTAIAIGIPARWLLRWLLARGITIVQNPDDHAWLTNLGIREPRIRMIRGSGVDPEVFSPGSQADDELRVVLVSRMIWDKGIKEFVDAARQIRGSGMSARFILIGAPDPQNRASISEEQLIDWAAEGVVEWWGERDDVPAVLGRASIACLPSAYGEGVPKSLLEAASCGLPIVATDWPGCREVVHHGENGLLVPPRDSDALASALMELLADPERRTVMGKRSRKLALAEFTVDRVVEETLSVYREVLS